MIWNTLELPEEALVEELWKEDDHETPLELLDEQDLIYDARYTWEEIFEEEPVEQEPEPEIPEPEPFPFGRWQPY